MDKNFSRLLDTLSVLMRGSKLSTTDIQARLAARGHDVTARTVQRDLEQLAKVYPLESDERSKPYGWCWRKDAAVLSLPGMDWPEALSFRLLNTYLSGLLPASVLDNLQPYFGEAERKLAQQFGQLPLRDWPQRIRLLSPGLQLLPPKTLRVVHAAVTEAVLRGRQLAIRYHAAADTEVRAYIVSPLGLVQHGAVFYVPVRFKGYEDVRMITVHRIEQAKVVEEAAVGLDTFDLGRWIEAGAFGFGGSVSVRLQVRFHEGAGAILIESPLSQDQQITLESPGVHFLSATVIETEQLKRWLLGFGTNVEVLAPASLRQSIATTVHAAADRYGRPTETETMPLSAEQ